MINQGKTRLCASTIIMLLGMLLLAACNYSGLEIDRSNADLLKEAVANTKAAKSYHLALSNTDATGYTAKTSGDVDVTNDRLELEVTRKSGTTRYILIGQDAFLSDDSGHTYFKDNEYTQDDFFSQLNDLTPEEISKASNTIRDGAPAIDSIEGVATKHIVADYNDIPSLITLHTSDDSPTPGTVDIWVTLGPRPTIRRLKIGAKENAEAGMTLDWSKLDEPVAIETPEVTEVNNADLIKKAAANMEAADSYAVSVDMIESDLNITLDGQIDLINSKSHMEMEVGGMTLTLITVDGDSYTSMDKGNTYSQSDFGEVFTSGLSNFTDLWDGFAPAGLDQETSIFKDGNPLTEMVDGVRTRHITFASDPMFSLTSAGDAGAPTATVDLWVSMGDKPYIYKMGIDGVSNGQRIMGTFKWSRFNEEFDIKAPPAETYAKPTPAPTAVVAGAPPRMTLADFKDIYDDPAKRPLILDVRTKDLYDEGHIAGAINIPEAEIASRVSELPKDRLIVAYCQ